MYSQFPCVTFSNKVTVGTVKPPSEVESRTRGSRPRTQKKSEAKAKDNLFEDRHSRGQGQECSRPRTQAQVLSKEKKKKVFTKIFQAISKKKKVFTKIFQAISTKKRFPKIFQALHKFLTIQKIMLSSSRGQADFRGLEASRPRPRTSKCVLEDVLEDSTSGLHHMWAGDSLTRKLELRSLRVFLPRPLIKLNVIAIYYSNKVHVFDRRRNTCAMDVISGRPFCSQAILLSVKLLQCKLYSIKNLQLYYFLASD